MNTSDDLETRAKNGEWLTSEEADELDERRPTWREEREAVKAMTPAERQVWIEKTYAVADLSVLEGLDRPRRQDSFHRIETWEQARARLEGLPEPIRTQRLAELEALRGRRICNKRPLSPQCYWLGRAMLHRMNAEFTPPPDQPEVKTVQVELNLRVENNNSFVRGKGRSREEIEQQVLSRYGMQKRSKDSWVYLLTIPHTSDEELDTIIAELFEEAERIADLRNGFTEADIQEIGGRERSW